ncbi:unnamed protein product, partial [Ectocarpus sp. 6 AP-2014]
HKDILKEILSKVVEDRLFEEAVLKKVEKKKPDVHPTKKALDKVVTTNGACVMGILKSSLAPELQAATNSLASATTKLKEGLEQAAGAETGTAGKKTPAKGKKATTGSATPNNGSTPSKVTLDGTQHAKLVDDVAAKVYGLVEPRLMAMAQYIIGTVSASKPAATPPDPTPIRRSNKAPSSSSKKHREVPSLSPSSTDPSSSSSDAETPSPPKKQKRGRPRKQALAATDVNQQAVPPAAAHPMQAPAHPYYGAAPGFHAAPRLPPAAAASFIPQNPGGWMMPNLF